VPQLATLLTQIVVVLAASRLVGRVFRAIHQPQVVGEMVAGILLGPSLLGWIAPRASAAIFPPQSLGTLGLLSQVGLILFMFVVGMELDTHALRGRRRTALVTSNVSIVVPFALGVLLAVYLYPRLSDGGVRFLHFALFLGAAMSITAFPVLARILTERDLLRTEVGSVAIACAAVDDASAWCILAAVVMVVRAASVGTPLWLTLSGAVVYVLVMLLAVRPALRGLAAAYRRRGGLTQPIVATVLLLAFSSGWATERLGIHALFGAFLMGAVMPRDSGLVRALSDSLSRITIVLFLPLFFAFNGLRTRLGLLGDRDAWMSCALIIAVAIAGKCGGAAIAARTTGMRWREAWALGVLMNTRGLMELVILNVGLDVGVVSPTLFTMMVLMALVTTLMTTPLLDWIDAAGVRRSRTP